MTPLQFGPLVRLFGTWRGRKREDAFRCSLFTIMRRTILRTTKDGQAMGNQNERFLIRHYDYATRMIGDNVASKA